MRFRFRDIKLNLSAQDLINDLNESPGIAPMATLDPLDMLWLEMLGQPA